MTELTTLSKLSDFRQNIPDNYRVAGNKFLDYLEANDYEIGNPAGWHAFVASLDEVQTDGKVRGKAYAPRTQSKYIAAMVDRIRVAADNPAIPVGIKAQVDKELRKIKRPRAEDPDPRCLRPAEVMRLIREIPDEETRLIVDCLFSSAMRVSELVNLPLKAIKQENEDFMVARFVGKARVPRKVRIPVALYHRIREFFGGAVFLFERPNGGQYKRQFITMRITRYSKRILGKPISAHVLRHSALTHYYQVTGDVIKTQKKAGHKRPSTTVNYYVHSELSADEEKEILAAAYCQN